MRLVKAPAYSVGRSRRTLSLTMNEPTGPGPADYSLSRNFADGSPRALIGAGERTRLESLESIPGPGSYHPKHVPRKAPAALLISRRAEKNLQAELPGPSDYSPLTPRHTLSYSFQGKPSEKPDTRPGPTSYEVKPTVKSSPKAVIGNSKRFNNEDISEIPGPIYSPRLPLSVPGGSFGKGKRRYLPVSEAPGVGTYRTTSNDTTMGVAMKGKRPQTTSKPPEGPGPADYTVTYDDYTPTNGTISKGPRFPKAKETSTSIGLTGDVAKQKGPAFSIGRGKRSNIELNQPWPGPGAYVTFDHRERSPKYSMRIRYSSGLRLIPVMDI